MTTVPKVPAPGLRLAAARATLGDRLFGPFDLTVAPGERVAVLGPSGAGKSTLLRIIAGDLPVDSGQALLANTAISDWPVRALARRRAVLPQAHGVAFPLPVELIAGLGRIAVDPDPARPVIVARALRLARAASLRGRLFQTLSGGEQARVQLARVMAQLWDVEGGLILVDEPVAALDPGLQLEILAALTAFAAGRGHALVAVLHDLNQAYAHFDRFWLVDGGHLVNDLPASRAAVPALEALFDIRLDCAALPGAPLAVVVRGRRGQAGTLLEAPAAAISP